MTRAIHCLAVLLVAACAPNQHVDAPQTTSATIQAPAQPAPGAQDDTAMPFDLPKLPARSSVNTPPTDDVATRAAAQRDADITATIRKAVAEDPNLSPDAKAVQIIVDDRKVVLRGRVKTEQERMDIDAKARGASGVIEVDDRIELVP